MNKHISFNKPFLTGKEIAYIQEAISSGKISGDGLFTKKVHAYFENIYNFKKVLLTTSCTDALEMAAILIDIKEGDEVIVPSYTFVSTVNAFVLRGAKIVFVDSGTENPNIDIEAIEPLITHRTKAIIPVHYAGIACDMDKIMALANKHNLFVIEDAALAIDSYYNGKLLGSIGHLATFSFHETKNIISGEGGMLVINDERFLRRAEVVREKGTNRSSFYRGEIDKYGWVDIGSSFLPSDIIAAFLYAQLENLDMIQERRREIWNLYNEKLKSILNYGVILPIIPTYASNNANMYYMVCNNLAERIELINYLSNQNITAVFHYLALHKSPYYHNKHDGRELPNSDNYSDCLLRLPFYFELTNEDVEKITDHIIQFYKKL